LLTAGGKGIILHSARGPGGGRQWSCRHFWPLFAALFAAAEVCFLVVCLNYVSFSAYFIDLGFFIWSGTVIFSRHGGSGLRRLVCVKFYVCFMTFYIIYVSFAGFLTRPGRTAPSRSSRGQTERRPAPALIFTLAFWSISWYKS
jgi:hypothetical protein